MAPWGKRGGRRCRLGDERGIALIMALGMMLVLSFGATLVIQYSTSSMNQATGGRADSEALSVAEAGLTHAISVLAALPDPAVPTTLSSGGEILFEDGRYSYSGTRSGTMWTLSATGTVDNPTGGSVRTRTVSAQAQITGGAPVGGAWEYVFVENPAGCFTIENSVTITAPLHVDGDFCLKNSASYRGPLLDVGGTVQTEGQASVGTSEDPAPLVRVAGGCRHTTVVPFVALCGPTQRVWTDVFSLTPPAVTKPPVDLSDWYANAKPGPQRYCTSGSFPGGATSFDNDTVRNSSAAAVNLLTTTSYDCTVVEGGHVVGRIAWTYGDPGTLIVQGVLYFDGSIVMNTNIQARYTGRATIYASGPIVFDGTTSICVTDDCAGGWDPNSNAIIFVSGSSDIGAIDLRNQAKVQAAVYAVGGFRISNNAMFSGPVVTDTASASNSGLLGGWVPIVTPITGMPTTEAEGAEPVQVTIVPSSWRS